jgi:hypothetical protein
MAEKARQRPYLTRLLVTLAISVIFVAVFNEVTYLLQKEDFDRLPKTVQLVIPPGTAERVAAGGSVPGIPEEMVFVLGDILEVKNKDSEAHQLGPLWVPPGGTSSLVMKEPNKYSYACSFQASNYLGLDVRQGTTLATRITAMLLAAPTLTALLFIYSLAVWPINAEKSAKKERGMSFTPAGATRQAGESQASGDQLGQAPEALNSFGANGRPKTADLGESAD